MTKTKARILAGFFVVLLCLTGGRLRRRPYAPSGLRPDEVADLTMWLDPETDVTSSATTKKVSAWSDRTGNINDFTQGTAANQPVLTGNANVENRVLYSNTFSNSYWYQYQIAAPTQNLNDCCGNANASWTIQSNSTNPQQHKLLLYPSTLYFISGETYTISTYVKYINWDKIIVGVQLGGRNNLVNLNPDTCVINDDGDDIVSSSATDVSGWCHLVFTFEAQATGATNLHIAFDDDTDANGIGSPTMAGTEKFGLYNVQMHHSSVPNVFVETTTYPVYAGIGGHKGIYFDNNDQLQTTSTLDDILDADAKTLFVVARLEESTINRWIIGDTSSNFYFRLWYVYFQASNNDGTVDTAQYSAASRDNMVLVFTLKHDGTTLYNDNNVGDSGSAVTGSTASMTSAVRLGWTSAGPIGTVADIVAYDRFLTNSEIQGIESYLCGKYGASC